MKTATELDIRLISAWILINDKSLLKAVTAKFENNDNLKAFLILAEDSQIVEANKIDKFWSCGWSLSVNLTK